MQLESMDEALKNGLWSTFGEQLAYSAKPSEFDFDKFLMVSIGTYS